LARAARHNGRVTESPAALMTVGRVGRLAARLQAAARRPVLWGASDAGDVVLAAAVTVAAIVTAALGVLYVQHFPHIALGAGVTRLHAPPLHAPPPPGPQPQASRMLPLRSLETIGVVATTAPLAFRRTYPTAAFGVILVAFIADESYTTAITVAAAIFAAYSAVAYSRHRRTTLLALLAAAVIITVAYPEATTQVPERYTPLLVLLPTAAMGYLMRMWRRRAAESAERLRLAQAAHEAETRQAVETERARIASELHDVVTHNVSVMVVQAGAARRVLESTAGDAPLAGKALLAREAMLAVEGSGRTAMTELRHLLGLLAPAGDALAASPSGAAGAGAGELSPQPGLDLVPGLLERVRAAGLEAELSVSGAKRPLPPGLDLAAYRVVQESLTNVIRHAGAARTVVHVEYRQRELRIKVSDDGSAAGASQAPGRPSGPAGPGGRGLIGLRERIAVYRGKLDAGPRPGGGWQVSAGIPLDPAADGPDEPPAGVQPTSAEARAAIRATSP
jgi:signal transduction histidine kinase